MENSSLHTQKVTILSRLVKDNQITLEEALLLLKAEEETPVTVAPSWIPGTASPYIQPYTGSGTGIVFSSSTAGTTAGFNISSGNNTTTVSNSNATYTTTADLNN
jgi:hypothetical protein